MVLQETHMEDDIMTKRFLCLTLCILLIALSICACRDNTAEPDTTPTTTAATTEETTVATTVATTAATTAPEEPEDDGIYIPRPEKNLPRVLLFTEYPPRRKNRRILRILLTVRTPNSDLTICVITWSYIRKEWFNADITSQ